MKSKTSRFPFNSQFYVSLADSDEESSDIPANPSMSARSQHLLRSEVTLLNQPLPDQSFSSRIASSSTLSDALQLQSSVRDQLVDWRRQIQQSNQKVENDRLVASSSQQTTGWHQERVFGPEQQRQEKTQQMTPQTSFNDEAQQHCPDGGERSGSSLNSPSIQQIVDQYKSDSMMTSTPTLTRFSKPAGNVAYITTPIRKGREVPQGSKSKVSIFISNNGSSRSQLVSAQSADRTARTDPRDIPGAGTKETADQLIVPSQSQSRIRSTDAARDSLEHLKLKQVSRILGKRRAEVSISNNGRSRSHLVSAQSVDRTASTDLRDIPGAGTKETADQHLVPSQSRIRSPNATRDPLKQLELQRIPRTSGKRRAEVSISDNDSSRSQLVSAQSADEAQQSQRLAPTVNLSGIRSRSNPKPVAAIDKPLEYPMIVFVPCETSQDDDEVGQWQDANQLPEETVTALVKMIKRIYRHPKYIKKYRQVTNPNVYSTHAEKCIGHQIITRGRGQPNSAYGRRRTCQMCRKEQRLCVQQIRLPDQTETKFGILPLPDADRRGKRWTELGFWVIKS